ncbi:hypothetical protein PFISCL1PPCAC_17403, partial [Pristionchus fissidentatus]
QEPPPYCGSDIIIVTQSVDTGETINLKMAAPFDSDDLMKRSLFGAIFGYKKNPSNNSRSRASSVDHPDQPGPSWASAPQPHHHHAAVAAAAPPPAAHVDVAPAPIADAYPAYNPHVFPGPHPPLPVLTAQCPFRRGLQPSYSSLAHQHQSVPPPPPAPAPAPMLAPLYPPGGAPYAPPPYTPYAPMDQYKTKADIYREIVNECEEFERSTTTTPLVDSSPATPTVNSPTAAATCPWSAQQQQQQLQQLQQPINEITNHLSYHSLDHQRVATMIQQQVDIKPLLGNQMSLEDLVKFVVQAVKETSGSPNAITTQSPEEILKRKRQMNNEAAARYRKRQREEKDKQNGELDALEQRNLDLKRTVDDMEREIEVLKKYVLEQSRNSVVTKVEE